MTRRFTSERQYQFSGNTCLKSYMKERAVGLDPNYTTFIFEKRLKCNLIHN